ncbi:hypothetical protein VTL71DRAFT_10454 [Oculimacula yallundae]|uniref:Uncharacterized protein n=1 Tax=Oculimacula yallundae TaxID=86028 RepID=A0ABR4CT50_9HELO
MQLSYLISTFVALASTATAIPAPQALECYQSCSTNCVQAGNIRGGICDSAGYVTFPSAIYAVPLGTCTCLTGTGAESTPELSPEANCWSTCGTQCLQSGNIRGGLCDEAGTCTCLTSNKRDAFPAPQSATIDCYRTCSTGCVQAGNIRGGLCDSAGTCSCLTKREALPEPEAEPEPQSPVIDCYTNCSVGCVKAGHVRGGICSAAGDCTCYE